MPGREAVPRGLLNGVIIGLVLMTVFTAAWSADTLAAWPGVPGAVVTSAGGLTGLWFLVVAVRLARARQHTTTATTPEEERWRKRGGMAFGWVFTAEAVMIVVVVNVTGALGRPDLVLPAIALVVGLHFFPMARIFRRRIDVWLATALSAIGLAGLLALLLTDVRRDTVWGLVAVGAALTTSAYGAYFARLASDLLTRVARVTEGEGRQAVG